MTREGLIEMVALESGLSKSQAAKAIAAFQEAIIEGLKADGEVRLMNFGKFSAVKRAARAGRNPSTGETLQIPAATRVKFSASPLLHKAV